MNLNRTRKISREREKEREKKRVRDKGREGLKGAALPKILKSKILRKNVTW